MPYLLNKNVGANLRHPELGIVPPLCAVKITERQRRVLKDLVSVIIFDDVIIPKEEKKVHIKKKTFQDFVAEHGDIQKSAKEYDKYKKENNI